ncbi:MAG TPA: biopolymer transporter ExbD [Verrucomicrobiae bacterium]|nr:biopolymer transporter ExbD [Verrucomicrobiae bacterium]
MALLSAKQDEEVMAEINITPFTDVLLVLLIIFMILAAIVTPPGFEKELSKTNPSPVNPIHPPVEIDVMVNNRGRITVDGALATETTIYYVMYQASKKKPGKHVAITADAKAPYGIIIRILDAAKEAGLEDVGFVTS